MFGSATLTKLMASALLALPFASAMALPHNPEPDCHNGNSGVERRQEQNDKTAQGYTNIIYYANWRAYTKHYPQNLPAKRATHVIYSFADIKEDGEVFLSDEYADIEMLYPNDKATKDKKLLFGGMKQLYLLKKENPNLKTLISIAGAGYSGNLTLPASTPQGRTKIAKSSVQLLKDYGLDGLDLDWEFPQNAEEAKNYLDVLREIRKELDAYADELSKKKDKPKDVGERPKFELMIATSPGSQVYSILPLKELGATVDYVNLMAYDLSGSWEKITSHHANLFPSTECATCTPLSIAKAVDDYLEAGVPPERLVLGLPLYGRAFEKTEGLGAPFNGVGANGGVVDYFDLPREGATEFYDSTAGATWSFDSKKKTVVSYDTEDVSLLKTAWALAQDQPKDLAITVQDEIWANYKLQKPLAGMMYWDSYSDRPSGKGSIVELVADKGLGGKLKKSKNWMWYPDSVYENVRQNMGEEKPTFYAGPTSTASSTTAGPTTEASTVLSSLVPTATETEAY